MCNSVLKCKFDYMTVLISRPRLTPPQPQVRILRFLGRVPKHQEVRSPGHLRTARTVHRRHHLPRSEFKTVFPQCTTFLLGAFFCFFLFSKTTNSMFLTAFSGSRYPVCAWWLQLRQEPTVLQPRSVRHVPIPLPLLLRQVTVT